MPQVTGHYRSGDSLWIVCDTSDVPSGSSIEVQLLGRPYEPNIGSTPYVGAEETEIGFGGYYLTYATLMANVRILPSGSWGSVYIFTTQGDGIYPATKLPSYLPVVTDQYVWNRYTNAWAGEAGSCVANTLATVKEIHEYKEGKGSYKRYSIGWIYGNRKATDSQQEGMMYVEALNKLMTDGVPEYQLLAENQTYMHGALRHPDVYYYTNSAPTGVTAKQLAANNYNAVIEYAKPQRISDYDFYAAWDIIPIKERIIADGCVMMTLDLYTNFYNDAWADGIISEYKSGSFVDGHSVAIIGWKKIGELWYWICHNSWGISCGDNGLLYIPFYTDYPHEYYFIADGNYPYPDVPSTPTNLEMSARAGTSFFCGWYPSTGAVSYTLSYRPAGGVFKEITVTNTFSYITGLSPGTMYYVRVRANGANGGYSAWNDIGGISYYTQPAIPILEVVGSTPTTATLRVSINTTGTWNNLCVGRMDASYGSIVETITTIVNGGTVTFTNLTTGTTYYFRAYSEITATTLIQSYLSTQQSVLVSARPAQFAWTTPKVAGQSFSVTATEWNRLIQNVKDVHVYKLGSYNSVAYPMTTVSQGGIFYAGLFNQVKLAIGSINSTYIADKAKDNPIRASDLNTLVTKLNEIT